MTQLRGELAVHEVAGLVVEAVRTALAASPGGEPQRACVVPGDVAWDECGCGLLAVSPQRFFLSDDFPAGALGSSPRTSRCDPPWLVSELLVTVLRCAPTPHGAAVAPSCDQLDGVAAVTLADAYLTITATADVLCELRADERIVDFTLGEQVTRGPEGGCVGSELRAYVGLYR